jgi:PAS domain S-box-containing protein
MDFLARDDDLIDLVHESIIVHRADGRILAWNSASEVLYGWSKGEAVGKTLDDVFGPIGETEIRPLRDQVRAEGRGHIEMSRRTRHGATRLVEIRWAVGVLDGSAGEIVETGRDVTESRAAGDALRKSEHRYRNLFQAMAASFWELDFSPVGEMLYRKKKSGVVDSFERYFAENPGFVREMMRETRVIDVNEQTVTLFGRGDKAEMLGTVEPFWPETSTHIYAASVLSAIGGKLNYSAPTTLRTIEGREFPALFTACYPPDTFNKGTLLVGVIDMSREIEAQRRAAQMQSDMAHAARVSMLGELAASIAHEVNQPLAAISANAEAGLRWLDRGTPDFREVKALTSRIATDSRRAASIIGRIRAMASGSRVESVPVSMNDMVSEATVFLRNEIQKRDVRVSLSLSGGLPMLLGDKVQLQQVIVNLAMNALQAMGGDVSATRVLVLRTRLIESHVVLEVEDNGPGIHLDHLATLFDSFFTTRPDGMGMGLAIARSIVQGAGGTIVAENREGGGARFTVSLPAI